MKLWGGRFKTKTNKLVEEFTHSFSFDKNLFEYDIIQNIAYAKMLKKCKIFPAKQIDKIVSSLEEVQKEGVNKLNKNSEDIHTAIEEKLTKKIGEIASLIHTGRSRNDQVSTITRMYIKKEIKEINKIINNLQKIILNLAEKNLDGIIPGYTHLRKAQPVLLSHYLFAYIEMLKRDTERFQECFKRVDVIPLGSSAISGTSFPLDRKFLAKELGFSKISLNSVDAVSDRDFVIEFIFDCAILMMHLSRISEELILWSTEEFNLLEIDESFCTGSSIMPQKKNPDTLELTRAKTGRIYGNLMSILSVMKGLPLSYNRDMQEDKESLFDTVWTLKISLKVFCELFKSLKFNKERMQKLSTEGFLNATDLSDYLVKKGIPLRRAHKIVGELINYCLKKNKKLEDLKLEEYNKFCKLFEKDLYEKIDIKMCINNKKLIGGTSRENVVKMIKQTKRRLK